jgi:VCBS repeat-containing protein
VTDQTSLTGTAQVRVSLNNSPPSVQLTSPADGGLYSMAGPSIVPVRSNIADAEQPAGSLTCSLLVQLVHNNHTHQNPPISACSADVEITPVGCDGNTYHWRFTLTVTDPEGLASSASASLAPDCSTVPNQPPLALDDAAPVAQGGSVVIDVLANDSDADGTLIPSSVRIETPPSSGTASVNPITGAISYSHGGVSSSDSLTYTVADDDGARSNPATVSVTVLSSAGLVAAYGFEEGSGTTVTDGSGSGNAGSLGTATRTPSGRFGSALAFDGTSALVTIPGSSSLDLTDAMTLEAWVYPTANGGWRDVVYKGTNDVYYLEGSSDLSNRPAVGGTFSSPGPLYSTGALPLDAWSHLAATYDGATLNLYVNGLQVASRAQTGPIATSSGPLTLGGDPVYGQYFAGLIDEVRVYSRALSGVEIQGDMITPVHSAPVAAGDDATVAEGGSVAIDVAANDSDAGGALDLTSIQVVSPPAHGSVAIHADGTVTYTHDGSETLGDSFAYTIRDTAGWASNAATVTLTVTPVNDPPVAADDSATVAEGGAVVINVAAKDSDAEGALDLTSIEVASGPADGSVAVHPDGTVTYTHDGSETTSDSFTYTIRDAVGAQSNAATVTLTVTPVNDPPVAGDDSATVAEGGAVLIGLAANDTDPEGALDLTSIQIAQGPAHGSVAIEGSGTVLYTHDGSETTSDTFTYTIRDAVGAQSNAATVTLTVTPVNDPPVAANDGATVVRYASVVIDLAGNDTDVDSALNLASIQIASGPSHGSVAILGDGTVRYTEGGSQNVGDTFTYTIRDAQGAQSNVATVSLTVTSAPQVPAMNLLGAAALAAGLLATAFAALSRRPRRSGAGT